MKWGVCVEIVNGDGKSPLLSLVKAFDPVLAVYEGFCNLKQVSISQSLILLPHFYDYFILFPRLNMRGSVAVFKLPRKCRTRKNFKFEKTSATPFLCF